MRAYISCYHKWEKKERDKLVQTMLCIYRGEITVGETSEMCLRLGDQGEVLVFFETFNFLEYL